MNRLCFTYCSIDYTLDAADSCPQLVSPLPLYSTARTESWAGPGNKGMNKQGWLSRDPRVLIRRYSPREIPCNVASTGTMCLCRNRDDGSIFDLQLYTWYLWFKTHKCTYMYIATFPGPAQLSSSLQYGSTGAGFGILSHKRDISLENGKNGT